MKDFNLKGYLHNNKLINENFDHELDNYYANQAQFDKLHQDMKKEKDQMAKDKAAGKSVKSASKASQNYDDYMDNAYGKERYGMTNEKEDGDSMFGPNIEKSTAGKLSDYYRYADKPVKSAANSLDNLLGELIQDKSRLEELTDLITDLVDEYSKERSNDYSDY